MTSIKVSVTNTAVNVTIDGNLTSGMVGVPCSFEYGPEWKGLNKTAVFTAGSVTRDVLNAEGTVEVPPECLEYTGAQLQVGVYGTDADGTVVIPTIMADVRRILPGADPSGDESTRPELPVWAQLQAEVNALKESGTGGNGKPGEDGGYYTPAVSQPDANTAAFTFTPSKEGMPEAPERTVTLPAGPQGPRGETGAAGPAGADGKTPTRGVDYWTEADKAEIKAYVDEAILGGAW